MGTTYLLIILLWCSNPDTTVTAVQCRHDAITCVRKLYNFTTDDVIDQCLDKDDVPGRPDLPGMK